MNRVNLITKLRFFAAIAPITLLVAAPFLALGFYGFGAMPAVMHDNQYAALEAARGMETALYKMDWGRTQPDGLQIVQDQQRGFVGWVDAARAHASTQAQVDAIEKIAEAANPIFDGLRQAAPGDDSIEPRLRDLQGLVADLISADDAAMLTIAGRAEARARVMIIVTVVTAVIVPWLCFIAIVRMSAGAGEALREIRRGVENIAERAGAAPPSELAKDLGVIDAKLTELGYPKPNPMLAE
ncbi:MAG TPA: hypothetical protein VNF27_04775 [Candidatus Binataceae bacterium]|nr:hypothetical protein [Candidatus Binataceae bacterium]